MVNRYILCEVITHPTKIVRFGTKLEEPVEFSRLKWAVEEGLNLHGINCQAYELYDQNDELVDEHNIDTLLILQINIKNLSSTLVKYMTTVDDMVHLVNTLTQIVQNFETRISTLERPSMTPKK